MAWPVRSRSGRAEFGRVYLQSLIASAEERVDLHRTQGHRLRLLVATRRLRKLHAYENERHAPVGLAGSAQPRAAAAAVSVAGLAGMVLLGILELQHAGAFWVTLLEVPLLALAVVWFFLAVACLPGDEDSPDQGRPARG